MKSTFLLLLTFIVFCQFSRASHIVGGELTYRFLGNNQYEFTLNLFRDCSGIDVADEYQIDYGSLSCNIQRSFKVRKSSQEEISPVCPSKLSVCRGGDAPGIQRHTYIGVVELPTKCSDWVFSWNRLDEYRNSSITNINNPEKTGIYIEAKLNNLLFENNNSPVFENKPVAYLGINQGNSINPNPVDADGDKLVFKIITPRARKNAEISYKAPFNSLNPISSSPGLLLNPNTGSLTLNPTKEEISVTSILVEEYRNGQLIGSIVRDIQLIAEDLSNQNPVIKGINGGNSREYELCAGQRVCFKISAFDPDGQNVKLSASTSGTTGATFTPPNASTNPEGQYCWQVPANYPSDTYTFTVTAEDDNCPIIGQATETFTIKVNSLPKVTLPAFQTISCNQNFDLKPTINNGTMPFSYLWNTGAITESISIGPGKYTVSVTDAKGCKGNSLEAEIYSSLRVDFDHSRVCGAEEVQFTDISFTSKGVINKWSWDFGDTASANNTSTEQNPNHVFSAPGSYTVTLTAEDSEGCKGTYMNVVKVCDAPTADFFKLDSCKLKTLYFQDQSIASVCGIKSYQLSVDNQVKFFEGFGGFLQRPIYYPGNLYYLTSSWLPKDTGWHKVTVTIINEYNCVDTKTKDIYIYDNPYGRIPQPSYFLDCNNPARTFVVTDTVGGTSPIRFEWSTGSTNDSITVDTLGDYTVRIIDSLGCDTLITRYILDPLVPAASATIFCNPDDNILFADTSFHAWPIVNWEWNFGNGRTENFTDAASGTKQEYKYPSDGVYNVILTLTDATGCTESDTIVVNQTLPDSNFVVTPDSICSYQSISLQSPKGLYLDTLIWDLGSKQFVRVDFDSTNTATKNFSKDPTGKYYYNFSHKYPNGLNDTSLIVKLKMYYNTVNDSVSCVKEYTDTVKIFEELNVITTVDGACANDTIKLISKLQSGGPIVSQEWEVNKYLHSHVGTGNHLELKNKYPNDTSFFLNGDSTYIIKYTATNANGCKLEKTLPQHNVITMPIPLVCPENLCANRQTIFLYNCQSYSEGKVDSVYWNFGDPFSSPENNFSISASTFHIYSQEGTYNVSVEIFNKSKNCKADTTMPVYIYPLPLPDFTSSAPVCEGQPVNFYNQSSTTVNGSSIEFMTWILNEGDTSLARNPVYTYPKAGEYNVKLYVTDSISQCADTVSKTVVVNPTPKAGFYYTENELVTLRPIKFYDESVGANSWLWIWGDGDSTFISNPLNVNPEHTYSAAFPEVVIKQIVSNEFACTDTAIKALDLKIYLLLPNAFSPNGDLNNDGLSLIYKGIEELLEYRIYNRWGELIFDGGSDLNAAWDGTYKGKEQPLGTYVYYVKARDYLQNIITHSGKVTLIR